MSTPADIVNQQTASELEEVVVKTKRLTSDHFTIQKFLSEIDPFNFKLAKSNKVLVQFFPNEAMNSIFDVELVSKLSYYCLNAEIPGRTLATTEINIHGPAYKNPNQSTYNEINLVLLCDDELNQKRFFEQWLDHINPKNSFTFKYRNSYTGKIRIIQFSDFEEKTHVVDLVEAYPISVSTLATDWGGKEFHKVQVTITYRYWEEQPITEN